MKAKPKTKTRSTAARRGVKQQTRQSRMENANVKIDELTIGEAKELVALLGGASKASSPTAYEVGQKYFIRTVTHYYTGRVTKVTDGEIVLADAAWIADTGRFNEFLKNGAAKANEIEPYPDNCPVLVPRGGVIDASVWPHDLPRNVK